MQRREPEAKSLVEFKERSKMRGKHMSRDIGGGIQGREAEQKLHQFILEIGNEQMAETVLALETA